ncbi:Mov34/MPN/PAD-1 family protein [Ornithinibacillus bavariensis]|uniref:MPN domain-containing protein n=1 Tax=Ornithinibacillus bavariensis TaxID=545502 RepID=A0A919X8Q2_9BACI|nr:Mov34/MPN/PAD-1 family protein [Ornithinibacillus bavariensis]GIO28071.1 hypothetical protein J43TS3_26820 [Ornithinibacillus bavariensis]
MKGERVVRIPKELLQMVITRCHQVLPYECCGLLSGKSMKEVLTNWELKNESTTRSQFLVSQSNVRETLRKIEEKEEKVLMIYHSHPTAPPFPSRQDILHHPDVNVLMFIISFLNGRIDYKCFEVSGNGFSEVILEVF